MSVSSDARVGTELLGYRIEALLGRGGMGVVCRAYDPRLKRNVALKLLAPELAQDERFRERFLAESELAASLDHPNVIPIYEAGDADGVLFVAMRYVDGKDLKTLLRGGALTREKAIAIVEQIAGALDAAHGRGLVHRDVKPSNVLLDTRDHAYLADFGLTRRLGEPGAAPASGLSIGTPAYAAPEQIEGAEVDGRADQYSLGCLLYECLTGRPPFPRPTDAAVLFAHLDEKPPAPEGLEDVIATGLAKDPAERYRTCGELVDAARTALRIAEPRRARWPFIVAGIGAALLGAALLAFVLERGSSPSGPQSVPTLGTLALRPHAVSFVDAKTHRLAGQVDLRSAPWDVVFTGRTAWVLLGGDQRVARVDLETRKVTASVTLPWGPGGRIASGAGSIWVTEDIGARVARIDARTGKLADGFAVGRRGGGFAWSTDVAFGAGSLWLARGADVARVDPRSGRVLERIPISQPATWVVFANGAVWVASSGNGLVTKIDPVENRITATAKLHGWISDLAAGGGFVWVSVAPDGVVFKLSEDDASVQDSLASGPDPERISFVRGVLWVANTEANTLSLLDPGSGKRSELAVSSAPISVGHHDGIVWTGSVPSLAPLPPVARELELRISLAHGDIDYDLANSRWWSNEQLAYATCANLLNYPDSAGPEGTRLRPEIAAAMPTLSPDGRTYTFRIRPSFRFSPPSSYRPTALQQPANSVPETVTAETFRHTIERALSPRLRDPPGAQFASDIVGVAAYRAGKARHIRGIVARGDLLAIRLVRPAGDFLTRISMHFFCPVPRSEPVVPDGLTGAIPSAGPYYMAGSEGDRVVLLRNPNYTGTRPRRLERIVYTQGVATPKAVALADGGEVDYLPTNFDRYSPLARGGPLERRFGPGSLAARAGEQRYFLRPFPGFYAIVFNTRRPLFRDVRLRRAVNYALDRPALAAVSGDRPADRSIPPGVPGYRAEHVYPTDGPDFRTAGRLAGGQSRRAVLYFCGDPRNRSVAQIVRSDLTRIGIGVSIVESQGCPDGHDPKADRADLLLGGFGSAERDPSPFLEEALATAAYGSPLGPGPWSDSGFRERLEKARALRGDARINAYTRLDEQLTRDAVPFAVYASWLVPEYFSPRVGCRLVQAAYDFVDLGALCVRAR